MEELEQFFMKELKDLLSKYDELYLEPIIRDNGDFLIPLHPELSISEVEFVSNQLIKYVDNYN